jgi:amino acid transporter
MGDIRRSDEEPLLSRRSSSSLSSYSRTSKATHPEELGNDLQVSRSLEHDVIPETATYGRNLGWGSAYVLIISRVIGSGIFATPGTIAKSVGSIGLALLLWVVGALISWFGLAVSLEFGTMLPRSGVKFSEVKMGHIANSMTGHKVYLEFVYRHPRFLASTIVAVNAVLLGFTASNCIVFGQYVLFGLQIEPTPFAQNTLAVGLLTLITIIHSCFLKTGIFIQNVLGWVKVALIVFMAATGLFVVLIQPNISHTLDIQTQAFHWDVLFEGSVWNWGIISTALFKVFYSYAGLENLNNVMNEVKDPIRTLKSAAPIGLLTAFVLYLLINVAYFLVVPLDEIKQSGELIAALFFERTFGPTVGRTILPLAVAISAGGNVMVVTFALGKTSFQ